MAHKIDNSKGKEKRQSGEAVFFRISAELRAKLEKMAEKDSRTLTDYIRVQLIKIAGK